MKVIDIFGVIQGSVEIRGAVIEGREKEAKLRLSHHPVADPILEKVFQLIVA